MPSVIGDKVRRRVIPVIVLRSEVDDTVHDFVPSAFGRVQDPFHHGYSLLLVFFSLVGPEAKQELIETIVVPFDAVNRALQGIDLPKAEDAAVTRRTHRFLICNRIYFSNTIFELSGEELVECSELIDVFNKRFLKVHSIELSVSEEDVLSKVGR